MNNKICIRNKEIKKLLCFFGIHHWTFVDNNIPGVDRVFEQCTRCEEYGRLVYLRRFKYDNENTRFS